MPIKKEYYGRFALTETPAFLLETNETVPLDEVVEEEVGNEGNP